MPHFYGIFHLLVFTWGKAIESTWNGGRWAPAQSLVESPMRNLGMLLMLWIISSSDHVQTQYTPLAEDSSSHSYHSTEHRVCPRIHSSDVEG